MKHYIISKVICASFILFSYPITSCNSSHSRTRDSDKSILPNLDDSARIFLISSIDTIVKPIKVPLSQLANKSKSLHGRYIETEGIFHIGFENFSISSNSISTQNQDAFWLTTNKDLHIDFENIAGKNIKIKGILDTLNKGHLNGFSATISQIYFWEVK